MNETTVKTKKIVAVAMLSAVATVLMFFSFNVPLVPSFLKMDFSELPAIIASCLFGPISGIVVCLIKNLFNVMYSTTNGIGEMSNFILGVLLVVPAGIISEKLKGVKGVVIGTIVGALIMAVGSIFTNYFIVYPVYTTMMPMEAILGMYKAINPNADSLIKALIMFNLPFTFIKAMCGAAIFLIVRKPLTAGLKALNISFN